MFLVGIIHLLTAEDNSAIWKSVIFNIGLSHIRIRVYSSGEPKSWVDFQKGNRRRRHNGLAAYDRRIVSKSDSNLGQPNKGLKFKLRSSIWRRRVSPQIGDIKSWHHRINETPSGWSTFFDINSDVTRISYEINSRSREGARGSNMGSRLDVVSKIYYMLLYVVYWRVGSVRRPHTFNVNLGSLSSSENITVSEGNCNCGIGVRNVTASISSVRNVVMKCFDWSWELIWEVSLREEENSVIIGNWRIGIDVATVYVSWNFDQRTARRECD